MRIRLVLAAICIVAVPLLVSTPRGTNLTGTTPFASVAIAGHTMVGGWCQCGDPGCICDPGENPGGNGATPATDDIKSVDQALTPIRVPSHSGSDFGTGTLLLALTLLLWTRLRA
jgi:hypothetical protein